MIAAVLRKVADLVPPWLGWSVGLASALLLLVAVGRTMPSNPALGGLVALLVLALGLTAAEPAVIPLLSVPALLVVMRLTQLGVDISVSDVALALAFVPAVFLARRPYSRELRALLWLSAGYQLATLFTVVSNPYTANVVEWFHTWLLVSGALVVGWAVGRAGYASVAMTLLVLAAGALALVTLAQGLTQYAQGDFAPVYPSWPYSMHKNFVGPILAFVAVILYVHPDWTGWRRRWALGGFWLMVAGILVTQSRQALITLALTLAVVVFRSRSHQSRSRLIAWGTAPVAAFVAITVREQIESGNKFNSYFQRLSWFEDAVEVWNHSPWVGVGLRWWYTDRFELRIQPPNIVLEMLTTAGVVGLLGFVVLTVGALLVLRRVEPRYGTLPFALVVGLVIQAQFDVFWQSVRPSLPFLVAGIALGARALAAEGERLRALAEYHAGHAEVASPPGPEDASAGAELVR